MATQDAITGNDLFFQALIRSHVDAPRFVTRPWLAGRIEAALAAPGTSFVLVTGEPGAGKTAVMAWLAREHPTWPRYFIRRDSRTPLSSGDVRSFLLAIGHQLATLRPDLFRSERLRVVVEQRVREIRPGGRAIGIQVEDLLVSPFYQTALKVEQHAAIVAGDLIGLAVERLVTEPRVLEPENLQYLALLDPAAALLAEDPTARIVILIDALDELRYYRGQDGLLDWLAGGPQLPENLRIVISSRPEAILDTLRHRRAGQIRAVKIGEQTALIQADLGAYARRFAAQPSVQDALAGASMHGEDLVDRAVNRAEGNFQYLATLVRGLEQALGDGEREHLIRLLQPDAIPAGLEELYAFFLTSIKMSVINQQIEVPGERPFETSYDSAWEGLYQPILGVLAVAREPLTEQQIVSFTGLEAVERRLRGALERLGQFLERDGPGYRLYHTTLPEFLISRRTRDHHPACYLAPGEWHRKISDFYLARYRDRWDRCDSYGLTHLIEHLVAADGDEHRRGAALDAVLTDAFAGAVRARYGWLFPVVEDLAEVARVDPARAATQCLKLLKAGDPNSLLMQRALRLLVDLRPRLGALGNRRSSRDRTIDTVARILDERRPDALTRLEALLAGATGQVARSVIALALGETGRREASVPLLKLLKIARRGGSWAAADALIALREPATVPELLAWYDAAPANSDRQRVLYILGWMHAEAARLLIDRALASRDARIVGRGVDLFQLLPARPGDAERLLERLHHILQSDPARPADLGPWGDEWVQKRLVRALHQTRVTAAHPWLWRLRAHIARRGPRDPVERSQLEDAVRRALRDLTPADDAATAMEPGRHRSS